MTPMPQEKAFTHTWLSTVLSGVTKIDKFIWLNDMDRSNTELSAASFMYNKS